MLEVLNTLLWGPGTLALILGTGAWLTLRTGGFPQRNLGRALALSLGREARRKGRGGVSPFGSLMTALASTVGTGNIVGVAAALVSGGPGALVWMELAALLGLASKFAECMLAVKYRHVRRDGTHWGGPMAVMETRLGPAGAVFGRFYALFALLMAFAMGAMAQSGALADTFSAAFTLPRWRVGLVTAALALTILLGGIRRIADISTVLVPVMALLYLGGGLAVILGNLRRLPEAVTLMLRCAVAPEAALGGALGIVTRREALRWGVARSVFSNEAGLGSAAITAACADTEDPVKQGLISMTGVFFDTMVICTVTGLAICCSGTLGTADGAGAAGPVAHRRGVRAVCLYLRAGLCGSGRDNGIIPAGTGGGTALPGAVRTGGFCRGGDPHGHGPSAGGSCQRTDGLSEPRLSVAALRRNRRGMREKGTVKMAVNRKAKRVRNR